MPTKKFKIIRQQYLFLFQDSLRVGCVTLLNYFLSNSIAEGNHDIERTGFLCEATFFLTISLFG